MSRSIPITVNETSFPTKTALTAYVRQLIARYPVGSILEALDQEFCVALFKFHPDANLKIGSGLDRIEIRRDKYGNKHFQLHRVDGTDDDISWPWCVKHAK